MGAVGARGCVKYSNWLFEAHIYEVENQYICSTFIPAYRISSTIPSLNAVVRVALLGTIRLLKKHECVN